MARNAELQMELRNSVAAMEQMIESQQRIERIQRSLTYLRDLHSRMVSKNFNKILSMCSKKFLVAQCLAFSKVFVTASFYI